MEYPCVDICRLSAISTAITPSIGKIACLASPIVVWPGQIPRQHHTPFRISVFRRRIAANVTSLSEAPTIRLTPIWKAHKLVKPITTSASFLIQVSWRDNPYLSPLSLALFLTQPQHLIHVKTLQPPRRAR